MEFIKSSPGRHINLAPDNRMDALRLAGPIKINGTVHDAVVGDGAGSLAQLLDAPGQIAYATGAVQQAILRMYMKMYE